MHQYDCEWPLDDFKHFGFGFDRQHFSSAESLCLIECRFNEDSPIPHISESQLPEQELRTWMNRTSSDLEATSSNFCTRVLMTRTPVRKVEGVSDYLLPIPLSHQLFQEISKFFRIPPSFMEILKLRSHIFVEVPQGYDAEQPESKAYIFQSTRSMNGNFCACVSYCPEMGIMHAFIHGLDENEIRGFGCRLHQLAAMASLPAFIPSILLEERESMCRKSLSNCSASLFEIERTTGLVTKWDATRESMAPYTTVIEPDKIDLGKITQDITSTSTKLAYVQYRCNTYLPVLQLLHQINDDTLSAIKGPRERKAVGLRVRGMLGRMGASMECTLARCAYQQARADIQRQTVYSMIAQRDGILSQTIAQASLRVAESAQTDGKIMKRLSEDSRTLAVLGLTESSSMRFLQIITMLFLPATFMATLFSTSFFDFHAPVGKPAVSPWVGLYFGLTFLLTLTIHVLWCIVTGRRGQQIATRFEGKDA